MAFNPTIDFWTTGTVADGSAMSAPLQKLLENDNFLKTMVFDAVCETQAEILAAITSATIHTILWKGNTTLIDFVASAGTFKLIYCQHYSLLGKNSTLVAPAGKNITIYGDLDCAAPATGGYSWALNCTSTSSIKCKWIRNSGVTGKIICDTGTVLYERLESGLTLETAGTPGSESYINQEFWDNTNSLLSDLSDYQNIWYLDTVNGLDTNSGRSRSAPKKTGDAVVIACGSTARTNGRLVVMAGSTGIVFTSANWSGSLTGSIFPFFDVVFETAYTECIWNGIETYAIFKVVGGIHVFNSCTCGGENIVKAKNCTVNGGTWTGLINFDLESYMTVNGMTSAGELCIQSPSLEITTGFMIGGTAKIQVNELSGDGSIYSYANSEVYLDVLANRFSLEGIFSFPSQSVDSSIKITVAKMQRTTTTKLLYLGAAANKTVNYQLVVDTMGSIVPMEVANPAGIVVGKVIELLYAPRVSATNPTDGQALIYQASTGLWIPTTINLDPVAHLATMDSGGAVDNIALQAGSSTQWSAHSGMAAAYGKIVPAVGTSLMGFVAPQIATGSFILAIFQVQDNGVHTLICESAVTAFPAAGAWINAVIASVETNLFIPANKRVYEVLFTNANGVAVLGKSASNNNLPPYISGIKTNLGVLTSAPKTITWESEVSTRPFIYFIK